MFTRNRISSILLVLVTLLASCGDEVRIAIPKAPGEIDLSDAFYYEINLEDRSGDTFKVRMFVDNLAASNSIFQFPATTPGTYDIHDIGRFVTTFKAFNDRYEEIAVTHTSTNQWILSDPENTAIIEFEVKETFDTPVTENNIYKMAGTSIENDHTLLNTFDVLGYPAGLKERDFYLTVNYPASWTIGTSLLRNEDGFYFATDYDKLVDNPLLLGKLTSAGTTIDGTVIQVHTYSKNALIQSSQILNDIQQVLDDANAFLEGLPVDRYSFLFHFAEATPGGGALEHSYSSVYTLTEQSYSVNYGNFLRNIAAHEFFHIVTPLNIHSEIIGNFNFAEPIPSEHLWLYEGVTEWASHMMQYRNQHRDINSLLSTFRSKKIESDNLYNPSISLSQMSLTCYTDEGGSQFGNVYRKGALVAALLDIRLLELSGGTKGLREVILELINTYGPNNAFSETTFFTDLTAMTYPEIEDFIERYIKGTDELPLAEYFDKLGSHSTLMTIHSLSMGHQQLLSKIFLRNGA